MKKETVKSGRRILCFTGAVAIGALAMGCFRENPAYDPSDQQEAAGSSDTGDGASGIVLKRCADAVCPENASCDETGGEAVCACNAGFEADGGACRDIDECEAGTHDCGENADCANADGGFDCACSPGYTGNGYACLDIDECATHTDDCDDAVARCENTPGGFACRCLFRGCDDGCCAEGAICHAGEGSCCMPTDCEVGGDLDQPDGCGNLLDCTPWVTISGGSFTMGSNGIGSWTAPEHGVTVPDFALWMTEVTVRQYADCVKNGPCTAPTQCGSAYNWGVSGRENHPVNCVTWHQAAKYCEWVGGRLPSEAEWEYVASNGAAEDPYPWGNETPSCDRAVYLLNTPGDCAGGGTRPVCSRTPEGDNADGLCDLAGNVWEWVEDDYFGFYGYDPNQNGTVDAPLDGRPWINNPREATRVIRGGGFGDLDEYLLAAARLNLAPDYVDTPFGFRCARDGD